MHQLTTLERQYGVTIEAPMKEVASVLTFLVVQGRQTAATKVQLELQVATSFVFKLLSENNIESSCMGYHESWCYGRWSQGQ